MAVTRREQQMLDLHDQGLSHVEIAARMGIQTGSVTRTLAKLSCDFAADRRHQAAMRDGSRQLASAIAELEGYV